MIDGTSEVPNRGERQTLIERAKTSVFLGKPDPEIIRQHEFQTLSPHLRNVFNQSWVWHGTGRFQYDPKNRGQVRDVLETIVAEDGLIPHKDALDFTQGEMESISTSPSWLYSFMYAQYHYEKGKSIIDKGRNGLIWAYYLAPVGYRALKEAFIHRNPDYTAMLNKETRDIFRNNARGFHNKASREAVDKNGMLRGGASDIPGNYPVLIGIKNEAFEPRDIAGALDKHEMRSEVPIALDNFTHIEVPEDKVEEVQQFLLDHGKNVSVYPIEWMIEVAKQVPANEVLTGSR